METLLPKFVESGFSREGTLFFSCHCLSPLHPYPHHLHDPRYASGFTYSLFHCHLVLRRGRILFVISCTYISLPLLLQIKFHYLPESLAIVFLGAVLGLLMTALPEAETKRVCLNESTLANGF